MQRGTYQFSMPYRVAIPAKGITAALQWTMSQSIISLQVTALTTDGSDPFGDILDLAFSSLAIIASTITAGVLLLSVLIYGLRKLTHPVPLASSCSLALSAAAHSQKSSIPPIDFDAAYREVQWGVTHYNEDRRGFLTRHFSFTSARDLEIVDEHALYIQASLGTIFYELFRLVGIFKALVKRQDSYNIKQMHDTLQGAGISTWYLSLEAKGKADDKRSGARLCLRSAD